MMLTQLFIMATGFLDTLMAGRYGTIDLAGVTLANNLMWPAFFLLTGMTMAITPVVAQLRGRGDLLEGGVMVRQALWLTAVAAACLVLVLRSGPALYARVAGLDSAAVAVASEYLCAVSWGVPAVVLYVSLRQVCEGLGKTLPPMLIAGAVVPVNGVLNYAWINGLWGFPELGGAGCGYATAVVFWLELLLMLYFVRQPFFRELQTFVRFSAPDPVRLAELLRVGVPIGLMVFMEVAVFSLLSVAVGRLGTTDLGAHSIVGNINWLTYVLPMGLGGAAGIRVGFFVGADQPAAARASGRTAMWMALGYGIVVSALLVVGRGWLISIYTSDPSVTQLAMGLILFVAVYQILDDMNAVATGSLRGYKDTRMPMIYGLIGFWVVAAPLAVAFGEGLLGFPELGVYGYWLGLTVGICGVATANVLRLLRTGQRLAAAPVAHNHAAAA